MTHERYQLFLKRLVKSHKGVVRTTAKYLLLHEARVLSLLKGGDITLLRAPTKQLEPGGGGRWVRLRTPCQTRELSAQEHAQLYTLVTSSLPLLRAVASEVKERYDGDVGAYARQPGRPVREVEIAQQYYRSHMHQYQRIEINNVMFRVSSLDALYKSCHKHLWCKYTDHRDAEAWCHGELEDIFELQFYADGPRYHVLKGKWYQTIAAGIPGVDTVSLLSRDAYALNAAPFCFVASIQPVNTVFITHGDNRNMCHVIAMRWS